MPVMHSIGSKLPQVGTTIFTIMSKMANDYGAINLSQGFPDFEVSEELVDLVCRSMKEGHNQYAPMPGVPRLRKAIARKIEDTYDMVLDINTQLTITAGATEGLYSTITALVHPGDEVIIFEPAYDLYEPAVLLSGGVIKKIPLYAPDFQVPWDRVRETISDSTRMIIMNTPHNPTGAVWQREDLENLYELVQDRPILILSDEVYEHIIFDGQPHCGVLSHEGLRAQSIATFSFGKTFHVTGWKLGYVIAPPEITNEIQRVHQFVTFAVNTPMQWAVAYYMENAEHYKSIAPFFQKKRDYFTELIKGSRFKPIKSRGTYFQLVTYDSISKESDWEIAQRLTKEQGIASIPVSSFYADRHDDHLLRFCFAKTDETLEKAAEILCKI